MDCPTFLGKWDGGCVSAKMTKQDGQKGFEGREEGW